MVHKKQLFALLLSMLPLTGCGTNQPMFTAEAGAQSPTVKTVTFAVVGDIMVHDYQYNESLEHSTGTYDYINNYQYMKQ